MKTTSAKAILIATSLLFPVCCLAQTKSQEAAAYTNSGIVKLQKNDLNGAIADFNHALQFDPKLAKAYTNRGIAKRRKHELIVYGAINASIPDYDLGIHKVETAELGSAIADLDRALELDPKSAMAYLNRGVAKECKGDRDAAMRDYNRALAIYPKYTGAYINRANIKWHEGDIDGAIADYNRALQLNPKNASTYHDRAGPELIKGDTGRAIADFNHALQLDPRMDSNYWGRGNANFLSRNWAAALRDYRRFCELSRRHQEYPRLAIWLIRSRVGEREAADTELAAHFNAEPGTWPSKIQAYLLGNLSESEFLAAVSPDLKINPGQRCEGLFYAGMKNLLDGNKTAAAEFFQKCVATGQRSVFEYLSAKAELKAMGQ